MGKGIIIAAALAAALCAGCNSLSSPSGQEGGPTPQERTAYASDAVSLLHLLAAPSEGTLAIGCKEGDQYGRGIERALQSRLRMAGYAAQLVLPADERQKGDKGRYSVPNLWIEVIPYEGTSYAELAVTFRGERFARLFQAKGRSPAPVSGWVKREREGSKAGEILP